MLIILIKLNGLSYKHMQNWDGGFTSGHAANVGLINTW